MIKTRKWLVVPVVLLLIGALFFSTIIVSANPATAVTVQPASQEGGYRGHLYCGYIRDS